MSISQGNNGGVVLHCHAGCQTPAVVAAIGLTMADLMPAGYPMNSKLPHVNTKPRIVATYDYRDGAGELHFQAVRFEPKDFKQRRPKPGGGWTWSVKGVRVIPYRLPELMAEPARPVVVVEGEKDADSLARLGVLATCNAGGAGKWTFNHARFLEDRCVAVLPDNDDPGRGHAQQVAQSLHGVAKTVRIVELPNLPPKGDATDWIAAGGTKEDLVRLFDATPDWTPETATTATTTEPAVPSFQPFPVDSLPEPVRAFVTSGALAMGCDPSYVALPLLSSIASAIGNTRRIQLKCSWCEPSVLWCVCIGESGTLKSPALDLALQTLRRRQSAAYREFMDATKEHERSQQLYDVDLSEWKRKGRKNDELPPEPPDSPVWTQLIAEDTTVEALAVLLEDQPRGVLVARDELSGWLNSFDAYKSARGADVAHWLSMHRAGNLLVNRKTGRKLIRVPRAAVCVCGGVQPQTLAAALAGRYSADGPEAMNKPPAEHFANGLAARLLLAMPPRVPKRWTDADLDSGAVLAIERLFDSLLSLEANVDEDGEWLPIDLPLAADARHRFIRFYDQHADETVGLSSDLAAAWSKLEGYAARFALIVELSTCPAAKAVTDASMAAGIELAQWFGEEAARCYTVLGSQGDSSNTRESREDDRLVAWIRNHGGQATVRELARGPRQYRDTSIAEAALCRLVDAGRGEWKDVPTGRGGGRPTRVFRLVTGGDGDKTTNIPRSIEVSSPSPVSPVAHESQNLVERLGNGDAEKIESGAERSESTKRIQVTI